MPVRKEFKRGLRQYIRFYETLTPETLSQLDKITTPSVRFKDPFNDVVGRAAYRKILENMFRDVSPPTFKVSETAWSDTGHAVIKWRFRCTAKRIGALDIDGLSHLRFDARGRVKEHVDYWDAAEYFYARLPLIGPLVRWIGRRLSA